DAHDAVRWSETPAPRSESGCGVIRRVTVDDAQSYDVARALESEHRGEVDQHVEGEALGGRQRGVRLDGEHLARKIEDDETCGRVAPAVYECHYEAASARTIACERRP